MNIALGSDHGGFELKEKIKELLRELGHDYVDYGTDNPASVDYPDYGEAVAKAVAEGKHDRGILICGTGIGMSIVANKVPGIRAALCYDLFGVKMAREHNDANILTMGGRMTGVDLAKEIVRTFLSTPFSGGERHRRRVDKISKIERKMGT
ncbi:MAG: ribose 5-phosphate isomerase B [bacterium]